MKRDFFLSFRLYSLILRENFHLHGPAMNRRLKGWVVLAGGVFALSCPRITRGAEPPSSPNVEIEETGYRESAVGFPGPPPAGEGLRLGLKDCVQMALLNNREIKATEYSVEGAKAKLLEARPRGIPVFSYEFISAPAPRDVDDAVKSFFEGDITFLQRGKIEMGIPVLSFGKIKLAQDLAKNGVLSEKEKRIEKQNDVVLTVQKLYYGLLLANDVHDLLEDANQHMESEVRRREEEKSDQPSNPVDLVRLKLFRYEILKRLGETEKRAALAKEGLLIQMGLERNTPYSLEEEHLVPVDFELKDFEYYLATSRKNFPKQKLVDIGLRASEQNYQLEKRKLAPDIGIGGFYEFGRTTDPIVGLTATDDFNDPFNFNRVGFGLRVKGEININSYRAKVKQAQADYFKSAMGRLAAQDGLALDLKDAYLTVLQGKRDMGNAEQAMKLARQYVFITKTNTDIGVGEKKDYADALQAYLVSRGRYLETVFDYNVAVAALQTKIGGVALHQEQEGIRYENQIDTPESQPANAPSETQPHGGAAGGGSDAPGGSG
jgi:outer membrane protein TolC